MFRMLLSTRTPTACFIKFPFTSNQIRCYSANTDEIEKWVTTLDEAQQKRIRFIQNEITLRKIQDQYAPTVEYLTVDNYQHIMNLSQNQRLKYYNYLCKSEYSGEGETIKSKMKKRIIEENRAMGFIGLWGENKTAHIEYGLGKGALIPKIYNKTIDKWRNVRTLWHDMLDAPKLIFDCSHSQHMTSRENHETAKQLALCFGNNRRNLQPFSLHYCGMDAQTPLWSSLLKKVPTLTTRPLPLKIHEKDVTEVFPKEKLVILTPDSPNILKEYNFDDHYVISSIVDRGDKMPISIAKAKQLNIRHARLPIDKYRITRFDKALTLDQVLAVMLEIKISNDWNKAFKRIASRKFN